MLYSIYASNGTTLESCGTKFSNNPTTPMVDSKEDMCVVVNSLKTFQTGIEFTLVPVSNKVEKACEFCGAPHHPEESRCM